MRVKRAYGGSLEEMAEEYRVIVVMTTIPPRIHTLEPVLDAMLGQTWPVEALYLSIPYKYNRTGESYVIPSWLRTKPGVRIVRCQDLGPGTHLLNGLRLERDPWAFIVVVDDDHIYSPDLVETLMRAAIAHPGSAVAAQGFLSIPGLEISRDSPRYLHDQGFAAGPVLVSYLGVVYQRGFFDDSVFDFSSVARQCKYQDDMWFSAHLARKGIRRVVLGGALGVQELKEMHLGPSSLTLWEENKPREVSEKCNGSLLRLYNDLWACRRRVVLSLGGLPPLALQKGSIQIDISLLSDGKSDPTLSSASLVASEMWGEALSSLSGLPGRIDLVYLCTEASDLHVGTRDRNSLGRTFWLDEMLVTGSDACQAYAAEPRVGDLLRDPLQWEGDPNTIIVLGTPTDVSARGGADLDAVIDCAAGRWSEYDADKSGDNVRTGDSPFCRIGELAAVSVGGLSAAGGK